MILGRSGLYKGNTCTPSFTGSLKAFLWIILCSRSLQSISWHIQTSSTLDTTYRMAFGFIDVFAAVSYGTLRIHQHTKAKKAKHYQPVLMDTAGGAVFYTVCPAPSLTHRLYMYICICYHMQAHKPSYQLHEVWGGCCCCLQDFIPVSLDIKKKPEELMQSH